MSKNPESFLSSESVANLTNEGIIINPSSATEQAIGCITCPFRTNGTVYVYEVMRCTGLKSGTVTPIMHRLFQRGALKNRRISTEGQMGRPFRILYSIGSTLRSAVTEKKPLPGCTKRKQ